MLKGKVTWKVEEVVEMFKEDAEVDYKVHSTLREHFDFWKETGVSNFALSVIEHGYRLKFLETPVSYEEPNNGSYRDNREWAIEQVKKLEEIQVVKRRLRSEIVCCNPLTVAINAGGKRRLCIDLS